MKNLVLEFYIEGIKIWKGSSSFPGIYDKIQADEIFHHFKVKKIFISYRAVTKNDRQKAS